MTGVPRLPSMEEMLTMVPYPAGSMYFSARLVPRNVEVRLKRRSDSQAASSSSATGCRASVLPPALFTMMSSRPKRSTAPSTSS